MAFRVLVCSPNLVEARQIASVVSFLSPGDFHFVHNAAEAVEKGLPAGLSCAFIDARTGEAAVQEWLQTISMLQSDLPCLVFHHGHQDLNFPALKKNGAKHILHWWFDREVVWDLIFESLPQGAMSSIPLAALQVVDAKDFDQKTVVPFDVFVHLPHNHKTLLVHRKGNVFESKAAQKSIDQGQNLYFLRTAQKEYLQYRQSVAPDSVAAGSDWVVQSLQMKRELFSLFSSIFQSVGTDFEHGKRTLAAADKIVKGIEGSFSQGASIQGTALAAGVNSEAWRQVELACGMKRALYQEALNVCRFVGAFAVLLGLKSEQRQSLMLAGLLHGIGLSHLGSFDLAMAQKDLGPQDLLLYKKYPEISVTMIRTQKVPLSEEVAEIILQHREQTDGKGFPRGIGIEKFHPLTSLFQIAFAFQKATALAEGESKRTPKAALDQLRVDVEAGRESLNLAVILQLIAKVKTI